MSHPVFFNFKFSILSLLLILLLVGETYAQDEVKSSTQSDKTLTKSSNFSIKNSEENISLTSKSSNIPSANLSNEDPLFSSLDKSITLDDNELYFSDEDFFKFGEEEGNFTQKSPTENSNENDNDNEDLENNGTQNLDSNTNSLKTNDGISKVTQDLNVETTSTLEDQKNQVNQDNQENQNQDKVSPNTQNLDNQNKSKGKVEAKNTEITKTFNPYESHYDPNYQDRETSIDLLNEVITYEVDCDNSKIKDNITAYLSTLPEIKLVNFESKQETIKDKIRLATEAFGYYHPKILLSIKDKNSTTINVEVMVGKPMWVRKVDVVVLGEALTNPFFMYIFRDLKLKQYARFEHSDYESLKSEIMTRALQLGYFDAHFVESKIYASVDENFADIRLVFNSGKGYYFGDVTFTGETQYKLLVDPLVTIQKKESFNMNKLSKVSSDLYAANYFSEAEVSPELDKLEDRMVPIRINLKRKKFNIVELGLGYSTDEKIRGKVNWNMPLINDYGHSINMQLALSKVKQEFLFRYNIPLDNPLLEYLYLLGVQSNDDLNDTKDLITSGQIHFVDKNIGVWKRDYGFTVQYEDFTQGNEKGTAYIIGPSYSISRYESFPTKDPKMGSNILFKIFGSPKTIGSEKSFIQFYGFAKYLMSPTKKSRLILRVEQGVNRGDDSLDVPPSFRFFTGGDTTVRGFSYKTISVRDYDGKLKGGRYLTVGSTEIQVPVMDKIRSTLFFDAGTATNQYRSDEWSYSVGTGIRYVSPIGLIKVDVGFGISETHVPFHLHFGIGPDL